MAILYTDDKLVMAILYANTVSVARTSNHWYLQSLLFFSFLP